MNTVYQLIHPLSSRSIVKKGHLISFRHDFRPNGIAHSLILPVTSIHSAYTNRTRLLYYVHGQPIQEHFMVTSKNIQLPASRPRKSFCDVFSSVGRLSARPPMFNEGKQIASCRDLDKVTSAHQVNKWYLMILPSSTALCVGDRYLIDSVHRITAKMPAEGVHPTKQTKRGMPITPHSISYVWCTLNPARGTRHKNRAAHSSKCDGRDHRPSLF